MDGQANLGVVAPGCDWVRVSRGGDPGDAPGAVLHAKAVVHDNELVFVTSAKLTPKALERNIEAGLLVRDRTLAQALAAHFQRLIDTSLVVPLPQVP